jgi:hypothetical protein
MDTWQILTQHKHWSVAVQLRRGLESGPFKGQRRKHHQTTVGCCGQGHCNLAAVLFLPKVHKVVPAAAGGGRCCCDAAAAGAASTIIEQGLVPQADKHQLLPELLRHCCTGGVIAKQPSITPS